MSHTQSTALKLRVTKNSISQPHREQVVGMLRPVLAESLELMLQMKQAHWNVRGQIFMQLHTLFDEGYQLAVQASDELAERLVQLGASVDASLSGVQTLSNLNTLSPEVTGCLPLLEALSESWAQFSAKLRNSIDKVGALGDPCTADLVTELSSQADVFVWKLEAHFQE